ncbi:SWI/SNF-related matrix-associated actin-dependent regulator of chromatin subfamily A-like protein 1 [Clonorchis sinensis]|uniref:26S proteasome non-ATPase regulatory subunit 14 n=1 Tax=Clonorchis sinensis TaxID=79923 RepID=G7YPP8_CLOSI|nr:SWI/SNF-related matrix-associated actin-dependent regulator of chromatin subfamily A-like protein 1 [Clonorchis sinensis]
MDRILRLSADGLAALGQSNAQPTDGPVPDSAEQVYISSLALLKMLKHGRAGVPMEVMGLMLGEFVDDYTVTVVDVFAMPQSGTGVSVEAVDPVFQAKMLDMLKQTGRYVFHHYLYCRRPEMVVGWYHSHPGFGCWLSGVDMNTQQSFEALSDRAVAVVVDPIQSVKGKVVIDAFRLINPNLVIANQEPRQTTSNVGHLNKPSLQALIHGLNRQYYSLPINYRKNQWETKMLMDLNKNTWKDGLALADYDAHCSNNHKTLTAMLDLVKAYHKSLEEEEKMTPEQLLVKNVGRMDPKRHLGENVESLMTANIAQCVGGMLHSVVIRLLTSVDAEAAAAEYAGMGIVSSNRAEASLLVSKGESIFLAVNRRPTILVFLDFKGAFDSVGPSVLLTTLAQHNPIPIFTFFRAGESVWTPAHHRARTFVPSNIPPNSLNRSVTGKLAMMEKGVTQSTNQSIASSSHVPVVTVVCYLSSRSTFEVQARYHAGLSELYKSMPTRQYIRRAKAMPGIAIDGLPSAVFKTFKSAFSANPSEAVEGNPTVKNLTDYLPGDLVRVLFPFQREGVSLALARSGRVLLADDMGLGKTIQALAVAAAYRSDWPLLIVAPSSVRFSWRDQCLRWLSGPLRITSADILVVANGRDMEGINQYTTRLITIISYDLMAKHAEQLRLCHFGVIIMDESHFLKNSKASRTKAAIPLLKATKRVLLLSGTPAVSRPAELYSQISGVAPNLFRGGFHEFGLRYCAAKECPWGWDYTGCSHMTELQLILEESIMIRRLKSDVLSQLPPKRRELVVLDPNVIKAGRLKFHAKRMVTSSLPSDERRAAMLQYFHETASVKVPALQQYVLDLVEVGRKFLVYAHHTEVLDALSNLLMEKSIDFIRIDGRTNSEQRSVVCRKFQQEENCLVALLSITAAGTGLNMTAASLVVFAELYWNPGALVQAEDRAYRIGQQDSVSVRYLLAEGTADDYIWSLIEKKLNVLSKAGLNQETFRTADTTRLGTTVQQSILDFFESELMTDDDEEVDRLLMNIHDPNMAGSSPVFEEEQNTKRTSPPAKRTKLTNLFAQTVTQPPAAPDVLNCSGRVLVSDTPETSPDKSSGQTADKDSVATPVALGPSSTSTDLEKTVTLEEDDTVLLEAAIAAEVAWLTEGLLTETDENQFSGN